MITNYYYNFPPYNLKKFTIPENFKSIIRLEVNGLLINEIFEILCTRKSKNIFWISSDKFNYKTEKTRQEQILK